MRPTVRLGKLHGIPVGLHWSSLVMFMLFSWALSAALRAAAGGYAPGAYWLAGTGFAGLFMLGLLAHEYAHARIAQRQSIRVRSITLWMLGGVSVIVVDGSRPCGVLTVGDVMRAAAVARLGATPDRSTHDDSFTGA